MNCGYAFRIFSILRSRTSRSEPGLYGEELALGLDGEARSVLHEQSIDPQETRTVNEETYCAQQAINEKLKADS